MQANFHWQNLRNGFLRSGLQERRSLKFGFFVFSHARVGRPRARGADDMPFSSPETCPLEQTFVVTTSLYTGIPGGCPDRNPAGFRLNACLPQSTSHIPSFAYALARELRATMVKQGGRTCLRPIRGSNIPHRMIASASELRGLDFQGFLQCCKPPPFTPRRRYVDRTTRDEDKTSRLRRRAVTISPITPGTTSPSSSNSWLRALSATRPLIVSSPGSIKSKRLLFGSR